jgi:hypothetical protein
MKREKIGGLAAAGTLAIMASTAVTASAGVQPPSSKTITVLGGGMVRAGKASVQEVNPTTALPSCHAIKYKGKAGYIAVQETAVTSFSGK